MVRHTSKILQHFCVLCCHEVCSFILELSALKGYRYQLITLSNMKLSTNNFEQAIIISVIKTKPSKPVAMSMLKL